MNILFNRSKLYLALLFFLGCNVSIISADALNKGVLDIFTNYFKDIDAIAIEFDQIDSNNNTASGILILDKKKYCFLFNYYAPFPLIISGNSRNVSIYNYSTDDLIRLGSEYNFLINQKNKSGMQEIKIVDAKEEEDYYILVLWLHSSEKKVQIYFSKKENQILKAVIRGADSLLTIVPNKVYPIYDIDHEIFVIKNPKHHGIPLRMNQKEIQLKYKKSLEDRIKLY